VALDLDLYAGLGSPVHRWEPRCRLVGLATLITGFAWVREPILVVPMLVVACALLTISRLPPGFVVRRLRAPGAFVLMLGLMLPLVSGGTVLWRLGPVPFHQDGLQQMLVILAKLVAVATTGLVLFGTAPLPVTVAAMRRLGLPAVLADMTVLSYRFIHELGSDLETMRIAAGLRGLRWRSRRPGAPSLLAVLATLVGSLFVSSHARAEQVHRAMLARGYSSNVPREAAGRPDRASVLAAVLASAAGLAFVVAEQLLASHGG